MRHLIPHLDTLSLPWQWAAGGGIASKVLNADDAAGARTVLLRSAPRAVTEDSRRRAHFHLGSEEFISLGPPFSFDDDAWNPRLAYAFLPPGTVHGRDVQVPDGYLLYLRTRGPAEPRFLTAHAAPAAPAGTPVRIADPTAGPWQARGGAAVRPLNVDPAGGEHAALIRMPDDYAGPLPVDAARQYEILTLEGRWRCAGAVHRGGAYACLTGADDPPAVRVEREALLVVHALSRCGDDRPPP